jgi:hypothetical protein
VTDRQPRVILGSGAHNSDGAKPREDTGREA